jgi:sec-independent protein translocase protein TatA
MLGLDNPLHIAIVLVVVLMVFGAKRLPEMGKSVGEGLRGFKHAVSGDAAAPDGLTEAVATPVVADHGRVAERERVPAEPVA